MFRIDRNQVKISPMRAAMVREVMQPAREIIREVSIDDSTEELIEAELPDDVGPEAETELPDEADLPEIEPEEFPQEPAAPSPEELAAERAEEIIRQAEEKAAGLVEDAQRRSEELIRMAEEEAEQVREAAHKRGYDEGTAAAKAEANAELEAKKLEDDELLRNVIEAVQSERTKIFGAIEDEVVKLTLTVAEKIIKLADENDDKVFESMIINALRQMNLEGKITIRVGVREYDRFFSSGSAVFALGDGTAVNAAVIKDPLLSDGDLIIDSDSGAINAGIDSQLRYIELAFNRTDDE